MLTNTSHRTNFLITTSIDGHVKFWQKQESGIEFVKHYRAHMQAVTGISGSADGQLFATISEDGNAKVFDVVNFGASVIKFSGRPRTYFPFRHDQYHQARLYPAFMLLGTSKGPSSGFACRVSISSLLTNNTPCLMLIGHVDQTLLLAQFGFTMAVEATHHSNSLRAYTASLFM